MGLSHLSKLWQAVSALLLFYTLNTWISSQGAEPVFGASLLSKARGPGALFGIVVGVPLLLLASCLGGSYARRAGSTPPQRIPCVWLKGLDLDLRSGRAYQYAVLALLAILPAASFVHFWHALLTEGVCERADAAAISHWDFSRAFPLDDRFRLSGGLGCGSGVTFFPGIEPAVLLALTALAYGALGWHLRQVFASRAAAPRSPPAAKQPAAEPDTPPAMGPSHAKRDVLGMIRAAFEGRDPGYAARKKEARGRLDGIEGRLGRLRQAGAPTACASQVLEEARWLTNYTEDWGGVERLRARLEGLLEAPPPDPVGQGADGSWGGCCEAPYRKLDPTIDALQLKATRSATPRQLAFMARLQDPEAMLADLWEMQVSDVAATGRNRRDELGAVQSAISQVVFKDEIRALLQDPRWGFAVGEGLEEAYRDYVRQTQHPRTGYWGPWYRFSGRLLMVQDLSFTFHQIHYLSGNIDRWEQVIDTTLAIRELIYPTGWRPSPDEAFNNHNDYDVAIIFSYGWAHMRRDQKAASATAIGEMLSWCLLVSLDEEGFDGDASVDAFYFGVRFLDVVGFWDPAKRFWRSADEPPPGLPDPYAVASRLQRGFSRVVDGSEAAETVTGILRSAVLLNEPGGRGGSMGSPATCSSPDGT